MEKEKNLSRQEMCPECGGESIIDITKFEMQPCSECGKLIKPCSVCYHDDVDCDKCKLKEELK